MTARSNKRVPCLQLRDLEARRGTRTRMVVWRFAYVLNVEGNGFILGAKITTHLMYKHAISMNYASSRFRYRDGQCHTGPVSLSDPESLVSLNSFSSTIE